MKKINYLILCSTIILAGIFSSCNEASNYPDATLPDETPAKFAQGTISTEGSFDFAVSVTPDFQEFYFTTRISDSDENRIMYTKLENGKWTQPALAPFAQDVYELSPAISPDGNRLFFASERPTEGKSGINIWMSKKEAGKWQEPICMESPINDQFNNGVSEVKDGSLYLRSIGGIHKCNKEGEKYATPAILPDEINQLDQADNAYVAPDESYIIFNAQSLVNHEPKTELYISFKDANGNWKNAIKMDETINAPDCHQMAPYVSPDGNFLFFTRYKGEDGDIYWVKASVIEKYK